MKSIITKALETKAHSNERAHVVENYIDTLTSDMEDFGTVDALESAKHGAKSAKNYTDMHYWMYEIYDLLANIKYEQRMIK